MTPTVDFEDVSAAGLEASPVADALAGLRANDARYYTRKHGVEYRTVPAAEAGETLEWVRRILKEERGIEIASPPLEVAELDVDGIRWPQVYFASGLAVNVLYTRAEGGKRAVGFKLSDGMEVPQELSGFRFARQRSKLAGEIRGSYFVIKGEY